MSELFQKHPGEDIWIIGSSKSMDFIDQKFFINKIVIGVQDVYRHFPCTYSLRKEAIGALDAAASGIPLILSEFDCGMSTSVRNSVPGAAWYFEHVDNQCDAVDLSVIGSHRLVVGADTLVSTLHLAAAMGAENILVCGYDGGSLDGQLTYGGYVRDATSNSDSFREWIYRTEWQLHAVRDRLQEVYGCRIYGLNPFLGYRLNGHDFAAASAAAGTPTCRPFAQTHRRTDTTTRAPKTPKRHDSQDQIVGAMHVATFPGWESIVAEQATRLRSSGLYHATSRFLIGVVGADPKAKPIINGLFEGRAEIHHLGALEAYEFPTLELLHRESMSADFQAWYIHTKGVSSQSVDAADHRQRMESVVIDNHAVCRELLEKYDVCGIDWRLTGFGEPHPHFGGNFWWARASYLRTLPPPSSLNRANRYEAEFWIGKCPDIRPFELFPPTNPYAKPSAWKGLEPHYRKLCEFGPSAHLDCIVDVGVDYGHTTFLFSEDFPTATVVGVANFELHQDAEAWVLSHLGRFPNVQIRTEKSRDAARNFGRPIDLVHIDGDHEYQSVKDDFESWLPWLKPDGRVVFHDTQSFRAVNQFFAELPGKKKELSIHYGLGCWFRGE